jgi:hypothetical protein
MAAAGIAGILLLVGAAVVILWLLSRGGVGQGAGGGSTGGSNEIPSQPINGIA